jgi:hypothetical protein
MSNWGQTEQIKELRAALEKIYGLTPRLGPNNVFREIRAIARNALDKDNPTVRE